MASRFLNAEPRSPEDPPNWSQTRQNTLNLEPSWTGDPQLITRMVDMAHLASISRWPTSRNLQLKKKEISTHPFRMAHISPIGNKMTARHPHVGPRSNPKHPSWIQNGSESQIRRKQPRKRSEFTFGRTDLKPKWAQGPRFGAKNLPTEAKIIPRHLNLKPK